MQLLISDLGNMRWQHFKGFQCRLVVCCLSMALAVVTVIIASYGTNTQKILEGG